MGPTGNGRSPKFNGRRQPSIDGTSRNREAASAAFSLVDGSGRSRRYRFSPPPPLVRADLHGLHPGLSFGARLEHLAVANNDSGGGGRLLVHDGAFLRGGVLHYIKFRGGLSVGSAGHDCCGCSRNKKLLHGVSSIVSVSLR